MTTEKLASCPFITEKRDEVRVTVLFDVVDQHLPLIVVHPDIVFRVRDVI